MQTSDYWKLESWERNEHTNLKTYVLVDDKTIIVRICQCTRNIRPPVKFLQEYAMDFRKKDIPYDIPDLRFPSFLAALSYATSHIIEDIIEIRQAKEKLKWLEKL